MALAMNTATHDLFVGPTTARARNSARAASAPGASTSARPRGQCRRVQPDRPWIGQRVVRHRRGARRVVHQPQQEHRGHQQWHGTGDVQPVVSWTRRRSPAPPSRSVPVRRSPCRRAVPSTIPVTFTGTGNLLKHVREAAATATLPSARQWLTEKTGYAVLTPTAGPEPTIRVALYASPKPVSAMRGGERSFPALSPGQSTLTLDGFRRSIPVRPSRPTSSAW